MKMQNPCEDPEPPWGSAAPQNSDKVIAESGFVASGIEL